MDRSPCKTWPLMGVAAIAFLSLPTLFAGETYSSAGSPEKSAGRLNCGAQIECMTPDGRVGHVSRLPAFDPGATALIMEDDTVSCLLQEGETNFVIELPGSKMLDRLTFLNENAGARGELKIAVSNHRLSPNSGEWKEVDGVIPFVHKRLFGVSLLGIEAKYVRLSFRVEKPGLTKSDVTENAAPQFHVSALDNALSSKFADLHNGHKPVLLSSISQSVAPLQLTANP